MLKTSWLATILLLGLFSCSSPLESKFEAKILLGNIITVNEAMPRAEAIAISNGEIIGVGTRAELESDLNDFELTIDSSFEGKTIMPGFIENHLHPTLAGILLPSKFITPYDWSLPGREVQGIQGRENYLTKLNELVAAHDSSDPFITWGYHELFHGSITRADLDNVSDSKALIVWQRSFHEVIVNTAALAALGISEQDFANNPNVDFEKGHFWELGLFAIFGKLAPIVLAPERMQSGMLDAFIHSQQNGITTIADQGFPMLDLDMELAHLNTVLEQSQVPVRTLLIGSGKTLAKGGFEQGLSILESLSERNSKQVTFLPKQAKILADGAFYSQLMQMEDGYLDGHHGEWIMPPEELEEAARVYWSAGYQLHIHVNGDKGVNVVLGIIEKLNEEMPREHKTVLHHYGYSAEDQAEQIAALGISVSANPFYLWALGDKYAEVGLGSERAHNITRLGDLERNNVPLSFHSDLPMAPASPLKLASVAVSRISANGNLLSASQRISLDTALKAITLDAARAIQQENTIGSIEVGKSADLTILEKDPYQVRPEQLGEIGITGTFLEGEYYPNSN